MKHPASYELYRYWQDLRGSRVAPDRREVEPSDIRAILGDTFILEAAGRDDFRFRLAGTRVCALFGRELRGRNFLSLWAEGDRDTAVTLLAAIAGDAAAAVIGFEARNVREQTVLGETLLLPLRQDGAGYTRVIGTLAPAEPPYWLGIHPVTSLAVASLRLIWPDERPGFLRRGTGGETPSAAVIETLRQVRHLIVYEGGKA